MLVFIKDKDKKNPVKITRELLFLSRSKKEIPLYYFAKYLYRTDITDVAAFLSNKETRKLRALTTIMGPEYKELVRNKYNFAAYLLKHNISHPAIISRNEKGVFVYKDRVQSVSSAEELLSFFENVFAVSGLTALFIKPYSEMGGTGCFLLEQKNLKIQLDTLAGQLLSSSHIHQEVIQQHPDIDNINPSCINSIRFNTLKQGSRPLILSAYMRFGRKGSVVDNSSSGGFYIPIDMSNGRLSKKGIQLMRCGGGVFYKHPDTQYELYNFQIPFFSQACNLIYTVIDLLPHKMLGLDIAISPDGPVLIEANDNFSIFGADISYGGYLNHPAVYSLLQ